MLDPTEITQVYKITTLVDITKTDVVTNGRKTKERYQQSNFEIFWQVIQLRIQPELVRISAEGSKDLKNYNFGKKFRGKKNVWEVIFEVEKSSPFGKNQEALYDDFNNVPFIDNLDENSKFTNAVFNCTDEQNKNLHCELVI